MTRRDGRIDNMDTTGNVEVKDFDEREDPWPFRVGTQEYAAVPSIGLGVMTELAGMQAKFSELQRQMAAGETDIEQIILVMQGLFAKILMPDDRQRFNDRLVDPVKPVGFRTLMNVITWLMECYGLRPTQPSSPSSSASAGSDSTNSTPGLQSVVVVTGLTDPPAAPST